MWHLSLAESGKYGRPSNSASGASFILLLFLFSAVGNLPNVPDITCWVDEPRVPTHIFRVGELQTKCTYWVVNVWYHLSSLHANDGGRKVNASYCGWA